MSSLFAQYANYLNAIGKLPIIEFCTVPLLNDELSSAVTRLNGIKVIDVSTTFLKIHLYLCMYFMLLLSQEVIQENIKSFNLQ